MNQVTNTMRAIVVEEKGKPAIFKEIPIPQPASGQVLVKIDSAPINPSDLAFLNGTYSSNKPYPCVPGFEGSGVVVLSGGGMIGWTLVGKRVAVTSATQFGCYAEYCVADATTCFEIDADLTLQQAAMTFVNPLSVMAMLEITKEKKSPAVVHTAAASALGINDHIEKGRMMVRYFQANGVRVINVIRRDEQIEILKKEGADVILNQNDPDFLAKLKSIAVTLQATVFFDALGGEITGQILDVMPYGSSAFVYGGLSLQPVGNVNIQDLIFKKKTVQGFWLTDWLKTRNILSQVMFIRKLKSLLKTQLKSEVSQEFPIEKFKDAVSFYKKNMSLGKVLLRPSLVPSQAEQSDALQQQAQVPLVEQVQEISLDEKKEQ